MDQQQPVQGQVQIKADEKELQGEYSNLVMIHHNLEEFTLNFIYIFPNGAQGKLLKSMIVSPGHAKRIFRALGENIARYEAQFGTIKEMLCHQQNPLKRRVLFLACIGPRWRVFVENGHRMGTERNLRSVLA